jgi:hypothetical protein
MRTDFDKCHNLSKRNVKLILKVLSDLEPLRGSSNKKTLYSTLSCVNWAFFGTCGPLKRSFHSRFKMAHACQKRPNLHTNSSNKLLFSTVSNISRDEGPRQDLHEDMSQIESQNMWQNKCC